jgi:hypothetical protein
LPSDWRCATGAAARQTRRRARAAFRPAAAARQRDPATQGPAQTDRSPAVLQTDRPLETLPREIPAALPRESAQPRQPKRGPVAAGCGAERMVVAALPPVVSLPAVSAAVVLSRVV